MALHLMESKFGEVPEGVRLRIEAITDLMELDRLADSILTAQSLEQMGF